MADDEIEELLTEEFGHRCKYCYRYNEFIGTCEWDDENTHEDDGERCIGFRWDDKAIELLRVQYELKKTDGMVENGWKRWLLKKKN